MITIAKCFDISAAHSLRMALESAGIPAFIPDEMTASVAPHLLFSNSGIRVQVPDEHAAEAKKIIEEQRPRS